MKKKFLSALVVTLVVIGACNKTPDNASEWKGTYAAALSNTNNISQVTVEEVDAATINMQLQLVSGGIASVVSLPTIKLQNSFSFPISFSDSLPGSGGTIVYTGTANMATNADSLVISAKGKSLSTDSVMILYFRGKRTSF